MLTGDDDLDIGFLYEIVARAERNPNVSRLPCRALFAAHDEVVKEHGLEAGSQICNFLFNIGDKSLKGESLLDRFNKVLHEMGIVVELVDYDNDSRFDSDTGYSIGNPVNGWHDRTDANGAATEDESRTHHFPQRRASFNSTYDIGDDVTQHSFANRPSSRSSMSRLQVGKTSEAPSVEGKPKPAAAVSNFPDSAQLGIQFLKGFLNGPGSSNNEKYREPADNPLANGHLLEDEVEMNKVYRESLAHIGRSSSFFPSSEESEESPIVRGSDENDEIGEQEPPFKMVYGRSLLDMIHAADMFSIRRLHSIRRRFLTQGWRKAEQSRQREIDAVMHGRRKLLLQTFGRIYNTTQKHYESMERAAYGRTRCLAPRAFDQWLRVARDGASKMYAARQHMMRANCFDAWQDITLLNEENVRHFRLRIRFASWRRELDRLKASETNAVVTQNRRLLRAPFFKLLSECRRRRADRTYERSRKERSFLRWLRGLRKNDDCSKDAENGNKSKVLQLGLRAWRQKSGTVVSADQSADALYLQRLLKRIFQELRAQSRLAPSARYISDEVNERILKTAYNRWRQRAQKLKEAKDMDREKTVHRAWMTWGDELRCQILNAQIEERITSEAMCKWIIACRFQIARRIKDGKLIRTMFSKFVRNTHDIRNRVAGFERRQDMRLLRPKFPCWREKVVELRRKEDEASELYERTLKYEALGIWCEKQQNMFKLEMRAENARFYFLTTGSLKELHARRLESTEQRRKEGYAKFRRRIKRKLAERSLGALRDKIRPVMDMNQQAVQFHRNKNLEIAWKLYGRWQEETAKRAELARYADGRYCLKVARHQLGHWAERFTQIQDAQEYSDQLYHGRVLRHTGAQLRKLSLRIFQVNSSIETSNSLRGRNFKKNTRNIIRLWAEKTGASIAAHGSPGPALSPTASLGIPVADELSSPTVPSYRFETPFKFSDLLSMPPSSQAHPSSFVTPNEGVSPSKRTRRVRELAQTSTTPSTPLYTPFAGRVLRLEPRTPKTASKSIQRRRVRKSPAGASVRFLDDEASESPTDGRLSTGRVSQSM